MVSKRRIYLAAMLTTAAVGFAAPALAQDADTGSNLAQQWEDFIHYINVLRPDLAGSYGQAILDSDYAPRDVYRLANDTRGYQEALARGERLEGLKGVIENVRKMIQQGFEDEAANPTEITKSIALLGGTLTQYQEGSRRLILSGEYALPQLLQKLIDTTADPMIRERIVTLLPQLGPGAVRGLSVALQSSDAGLQESLSLALGQIGYAHAGARLQELATRDRVLPRVRRAAESALSACVGRKNADKTVSQLFYDLALDYYRNAESLLPAEDYATANVWYWEEGTGLTFRAVPRAIFCDVYAMRMSRLALHHDKDAGEAVALWLAANLRRESDLEVGQTDPTWPTDAPGANHYALSAGPRYLLSVLARGLKDKDAAISWGAIEALARTGGADSLVQQDAEGVQPLVEALAFPDRRVRFLAASALADALPKERFEGSHAVTGVLNEALREEGKRTALVSVTGAQANAWIDATRAAGFEVVAESEPSKAFVAAKAAGVIDLVVLTGRPDPVKFIADLRSDPEFASVPVVVVFQSADLRRVAKEDGRVVTVAFDAEPKVVTDAITQAQALGVGEPLTAAEADAWVVRACGTVRVLGQTGNEVYDLKRVLDSLIARTEGDKPEAQMASASALAVLNEAKAQQAIAMLACASEGGQDVRLHAFAALSESLRRYGNLLSGEAINAVLAVVTSEEPMELRDAAAQALGAMNLPSEQIKELILGSE
jgi:HEAT repeat protein